MAITGGVWVAAGDVADGTFELPKSLSVYLDQSAPPVEDWKKLLEQELRRARVLIVICSPGSCKEFENDPLYFEIRWWIANRHTVSPILITPRGQEWIPDPLKERWPDQQTINLSLQNKTRYEVAVDNPIFAESIQRILNGIRSRVQGGYVGDGSLELPGTYQSQAGSVNVAGLYTWEKDKHFRYTGCNPNYARAAGFDSPKAMIGKTDDDMPWHEFAGFFRQGDQGVMDAEPRPRLLVHEQEIMVDRVADIMVTETQVLTSSGEVVGVQGVFVDITGKELVSMAMPDNREAEFPLGPEFGNQSLSRIEANVFRVLLRMFTAERIASTLNITKAEVESSIATIMHKLQCKTLGDVFATATRAGLLLTLFDLQCVDSKASKDQG